MNNMQILPAILPKNFSEIEDKIALVKGIAPLVQVDICDGKFVPSTTWPYRKADDNYEAIHGKKKECQNGRILIMNLTL